MSSDVVLFSVRIKVFSIETYFFRLSLQQEIFRQSENFAAILMDCFSLYEILLNVCPQYIYTRIILILRRSRTGTAWFYTSTSNKRAARPKLYTKSLTRDLKLMYSRLTLVRISIKLQAPRVLYIGTGVSLLFRERFLYI